MSQFSWLPFFIEMHSIIHKNYDKFSLCTLAHEIFGHIKDEEIKGNEVELKEIHPITFMLRFFMKRDNNRKNNLEQLKLAKEKMGITSPLPEDMFGIPSVNNTRCLFMPFAYSRADYIIDNIWHFSEKLLQNKNIDSDFDSLLSDRYPFLGISALTHFLFLLEPHIFYPFNKVMPLYNKFRNNIKNWQNYQEYCNQLKLKYPDYTPYELSYRADTNTLKETKGDINMDTKFNKNNNLMLNQILYGPPGTGKTYNTVIKAIEIIKPDIIKYDSDNNITNYREIKEEFDKLKETHQIEFVTFHQSYSYEDFVEGIKPLIDDKEQIKYYVQPGIFKNLCNEAQKVVSSQSSKEIDFSKTRIFKMSLGNTLGNDDDIYEYCIANNVVALGWGKDKDFSDCNSKSEISILDESWGAKAIEIFKLWMRKGDIILISNGNKNIRAIARITGDYEFNIETPIRYSQFRKVEWLYHGNDIPVSKIYDKILSQQAIYAFYSSNKEGTESYNGSIKTEYLNNIITGKINEEPDKPYILIIDEINRGNISKIFGELITLIEEDKRLGNEHELKVTLPYSQKTFGVPKNLYIIGTMNTADRSIALLDAALRRRFYFEEIMPKPEILNNKIVDGTNINLTQLLRQINCRIINKFDRDHQIGHSYFMNISSNTDLKRVFINKIHPLLNEYFYNETDTVAEVLNCTKGDLNNINKNWLNILEKAQKNDEK